MREIAPYLASEPKELGIQVDVTSVHHIEEPQRESYDCVVIGAFTRYDHYHSAFQEFIKRHVAWLNSAPNASYSVNLAVRKPGERTPQTNNYMWEPLMNSQWRSDRCVVITGVLHYPRYRQYGRFMIRLTIKMSGDETDTCKEVVYTNREQVANFAREIVHLIGRPMLK